MHGPHIDTFNHREMGVLNGYILELEAELGPHRLPPRNAEDEDLNLYVGNCFTGPYLGGSRAPARWETG